MLFKCPEAKTQYTFNKLKNIVKYISIIEREANPTNTVKASPQRTKGGDSMLTDKLVLESAKADLKPATFMLHFSHHCDYTNPLSLLIAASHQDHCSDMKGHMSMNFQIPAFPPPLFFGC